MPLCKIHISLYPLKKTQQTFYSIMWRFPTPCVTQISQRIWKVQVKIHLYPYMKYNSMSLSQNSHLVDNF